MHRLEPSTLGGHRTLWRPFLSLFFSHPMSLEERFGLLAGSQGELQRLICVYLQVHLLPACGVCKELLHLPTKTSWLANTLTAFAP